METLEGHVALVTGASAGLGAAIARELTLRGARVLIASRSRERIQHAADDIRLRLEADGPLPGVAAWHAPVPLVADVTDAKAAERLAGEARRRFGLLNILVCNAGGPPPSDFADTEDAGWQAGFELILLSAVRLIRAALPLMRESGHGRILLISSVSGFRPVSRLLLSNTLRPALMGLARHLAVELAPSGILVNTVAPGFFDTERSREVQQAIAEQRAIPVEQVLAQRVASVPLGRQGQPGELGRLAAFLLSPENTYMTGQTLILDGGLLLSD